MPPRFVTLLVYYVYNSWVIEGSSIFFLFQLIHFMTTEVFQKLFRKSFSEKVILFSCNVILYVLPLFNSKQRKFFSLQLKLVND